jgi:hypothetical protein
MNVQKYNPPEVGAAEPNSASARAMHTRNIPHVVHWAEVSVHSRACKFIRLTPQIMAEGPPYGIEYTRTELLYMSELIDHSQRDCG